jgi:hypothetical protein
MSFTRDSPMNIIRTKERSPRKNALIGFFISVSRLCWI